MYWAELPWVLYEVRWRNPRVSNNNISSIIRLSPSSQTPVINFDGCLLKNGRDLDFLWTCTILRAVFTIGHFYWTVALAFAWGPEREIRGKCDREDHSIYLLFKNKYGKNQPSILVWAYTKENGKLVRPVKRVDCKMRQHHDKHGRVSLAKKKLESRDEKRDPHTNMCVDCCASISFHRFVFLGKTNAIREAWTSETVNFQKTPQATNASGCILPASTRPKTEKKTKRKESNDYNSANMGVVLDVIRRGSHPIISTSISILSLWDLVLDLHRKSARII